MYKTVIFSKVLAKINKELSGIMFSLNIFYCLINVQLDWKQVIST